MIAEASIPPTEEVPALAYHGQRVAVLVSDLINPANREFLDGVVSSPALEGTHATIMPLKILTPSLRSQLLSEISDGDEWDGIILRGSGTDDDVDDWVRELDAMSPQSPVVTVGVALATGRRIVPDVEDGVRQAVHHLVDVHGRHRFAFVRRALSGSPQTNDHDDGNGSDVEEDLSADAALSRAWVDAYRDALTAHGLDGAAALVVDVRRGPETVYEAVASLLKQDPLVDAVIVSQADMAVDVCNAIRAHALGIPEDTSVIVLQPMETTMRAAAPALTTVAPLEHSLGAYAALALRRAMDGAGAGAEDTTATDGSGSGTSTGATGRTEGAVDELMPAELVLGRSCGCPVTRDAVPESVRVLEAGRESCSAASVGPAELATLDFTQMLMSKVSLSGLVQTMEVHFPTLGIEYALVARTLATMFKETALETAAETERIQAAVAGPESSVHFTGRSALVYADGQASPVAGEVQARLASMALPVPKGGSSVVLHPLVCGDQLLGLVQLGPWCGNAPLIYRSVSDGIAGLLFREGRFGGIDQPSSKAQSLTDETGVIRRILDRVRLVQTPESILAVALEELAESLAADVKSGHLGGAEELLAQGTMHGQVSVSSWSDDAWHPVMSHAIVRSRMVTALQPDGHQIVSAPLMLPSHEIVGVLGFSRKASYADEGAEPWSIDQLQFVERVASLVAQLVETANLLADLRRRAERLSIAVELSGAVTGMRDLEKLLERVVELIRERFGLAYAGIFLVDEERDWAVLVAGTGDAGETMVARGHRLRVGGDSMIGACVGDGHARVTGDTALENVWQPNPVLPDIRSELALPLVSRSQIIGALTVQDVAPAAFGDEDVEVLQMLADQLANAIENARLIEQMARDLRHLQAATTQFTSESWREYVKGRKTVWGYRRELLGLSAVSERHPEAQAAMEQGSSVVIPLNGDHGQGEVHDASFPKPSNGGGARAGVGVPIRLRNQVLGVLNLRFEDDHVPPEMVQLIEQIADRLAVSLETARLLEVTQQNAWREQLVADLTRRMRESLEVDEVLERSTREIRDALELFQVAVRLAPRQSGSLTEAGKPETVTTGGPRDLGRPESATEEDGDEEVPL